MMTIAQLHNDDRECVRQNPPTNGMKRTALRAAADAER
jgi:hypothetical protein